MVSLTRYERFSAFLTGQPYQRQRRVAKHDLRMRNMVPAGLTKGRLGKLSPEKYGAYMEVLEVIGRKFPKLEISSPWLSELERINLEGVDKKKLAYRVTAGIEGGSLNLAEIPRVAATMQRESLLKTTLSAELPPDPVRIMIDMIIGERKLFEQMVAKPETTIDTIFHGLEQAIQKGKLPFLNISIYRPLSDGRWSLTSRTRDWAGKAPSKYLNGGAYPSTTLKSVIEGREEMYDVDIKDISTFEAAGLTADRTSIKNDLKQSKGPGRTLFIKLVSRYGVEAVVQIHNRVGAEENIIPRELLPASQQEGSRIKEQLVEYFRNVSRAIEEVKAKSPIIRPEALAKGGAPKPGAPTEYNLGKEKEFWDWVFGSGKGRDVGLEAKIGGPVTARHRQDFTDAMRGRVSEAVSRGPVVIREDAAGERPIVTRLMEELKGEIDHGPRVLPERVSNNLTCEVRDLSEVALKRAEEIIAEAGFKQIVSIEQGNMFERSQRGNDSVDFVVACMGFYCTREKFRAALTEWARIAKPGTIGWFSIKAQDGDFRVVIKDTIKGVWRSVPFWLKLSTLYLYPLYKLFSLIAQRKRAGAFEYQTRLREGFESGRYYAPTYEWLQEDLTAAGLQPIVTSRSLAEQFFFVEWKRPEPPSK